MALLVAVVLVIDLAAWPNSREEATHSNARSSPVVLDQTNQPATSLRVTTDLVQIPVSVVDKEDRTVEGLSKENFYIFENGSAQAIVHFAPEDGPISACLVLDASGSMTTKFNRSIEAVHQVLGAAIAGDDYCLIRFNDSAEVLVNMTNNSTRIADMVQRTIPQGWTALLDAIYSGMQEVKNGRNWRKAMILISDGGDNRSRHTKKEILRMVREGDAQIYSIGIVPRGDQADWHYGVPLAFSPEEINGPALMKDISHRTGGRSFLIHEIDDLPAVIARITQELRHQYVLGYYPAITGTGGYRQIAVKVKTANGIKVRAYWRSGYYAPTQ